MLNNKTFCIFYINISVSASKTTAVPSTSVSKKHCNLPIATTFMRPLNRAPRAKKTPSTSVADTENPLYNYNELQFRDAATVSRPIVIRYENMYESVKVPSNTVQQSSVENSQEPFIDDSTPPLIDTNQVSSNGIDWPSCSHNSIFLSSQIDRAITLEMEKITKTTSTTPAKQPDKISMDKNNFKNDMISSKSSSNNIIPMQRTIINHPITTFLSNIVIDCFVKPNGMQTNNIINQNGIYSIIKVSRIMNTKYLLNEKLTKDILKFNSWEWKAIEVLLKHVEQYNFVNYNPKQIGGNGIIERSLDCLFQSESKFVNCFASYDHDNTENIIKITGKNYQHKCNLSNDRYLETIDKTVLESMSLN